MTSTLPTRSFVALPPPPDGLESVRREAGRRRRRKLAAAAGGGAGALAVAAAVLLSGGGAGVAVLKPAPPAGRLSTPPPAAMRAAATPHKHAGARDVTARLAQGRGGVTSTHNGAPGSTPGLHAVTAPVTGDGAERSPTPRLLRWQSREVTPPGAARICGGSTSNDSADVKAGVGWCLTATTQAVDGGVRLLLKACRDDTSGGTLTYQSAREVDFAVKQGGSTLWDWGRAHPDSPGAHQLIASADGCWNWAVDWPATTQNGKSAGHGTFTFVGTTAAGELSGFPPQSVTFSY